MRELSDASRAARAEKMKLNASMTNAMSPQNPSNIKGASTRPRKPTDPTSYTSEEDRVDIQFAPVGVSQRSGVIGSCEGHLILLLYGIMHSLTSEHLYALTLGTSSPE